MLNNDDESSFRIITIQSLSTQTLSKAHCHLFSSLEMNASRHSKESTAAVTARVYSNNENVNDAVR